MNYGFALCQGEGKGVPAEREQNLDPHFHMWDKINYLITCEMRNNSEKLIV